ncbi:transcriptional repressor CTCF-like [Contarinia nasturtii]|uniref:transcriptional repressor CTCF-like n=1 Tax=Contarinia nasturtii TaxID=265458 RepID=UPI0012D3EF4A|nr:transcriptional repressor CTCF-like [Contarinia nasturtii]XP_031618032.1 transcriptional repressor CTCF-like [Contarinia nasturtii]XP_031618033.1 transcriptional repressor CTCF-like [Contarinia nasturtii]
MEDTDEGTYFVDESGNYYYQATKDSEPVLTEPPDGDNIQFIVEEDDEGDDNLESVIEQATISSKTRKQNIITTKVEENDYETVAFDGNDGDNADGEVSYVYIMDDKGSAVDDGTNEELADDGVEEKVYEFEEDEELSEEESSPKKDKRKAAGSTATSSTAKSGKKSQVSLAMHMCNYCNYTSPKRYLLSRHMKSHSEERPYKCSVCERGFKTLASLQNHVNTHTGTKPHMCKYCDSCFTTSGELVRHVRYRHTHEKPHKCHECDYASVELSKLKRHIRCHTGERPYQCPHCTYASPDTFKLKRHLRIHTGEKPYECDVCQARFTQSNSLKAHKLIHSVGDKPVFQCELCPTTCGRKTDLRIHVQKLHTAEKPLKCKRCGNSFPDRYSYKIHTKTHEGEKCYKCELCLYASISARHLESHMLVHTDQKPFQCTQCDQAFRQKQLLKRHINLYHDPDYVPPTPKEKTHVCPSCDRQFRHKGNLIRHMSLHDPDSSVREHAMALKQGRKKRVQIVNGQQVEYIGFEGEEEYEGEEDYELDGEDETSIEQDMPTKKETIMAVGEDGQRYMVVEVINMEEDENSQIQLQDKDENMEIAELYLDDEDPLQDKGQGDRDMSTCFGFVEDDGGDEEEVDKSSIQLLDYVE